MDIDAQEFSAQKYPVTCLEIKLVQNSLMMRKDIFCKHYRNKVKLQLVTLTCKMVCTACVTGKMPSVGDKQFEKSI